MHLTLLRGPLLGLAGKLPPLVDFFGGTRPGSARADVPMRCMR